MLNIPVIYFKNKLDYQELNYIKDDVNIINSVISCGVQELSGINDTFEIIEEYIKPKYYKDCLKLVLNHFKQRSFLLISTTVDQISLCRILNSICTTKSTVRVNQNSGNKIKIWIY